MLTKLWVYNLGFWNGVVASRRSPSYDGTLRAICVPIPTYLYRARPRFPTVPLRASLSLPPRPSRACPYFLFPFYSLLRIAPGPEPDPLRVVSRTLLHAPPNARALPRGIPPHPPQCTTF